MQPFNQSRPARQNLRTATGGASASQLVSKQVVRQMIKSMTDAKREEKYYTVSTNTTVDSSGTIFALFQPPVGDVDTSRDGDQVDLTSGEFRFAIGGADSTNLVRIILFKWEQSTVPVPADIINPGYLSGTTAPLAPLNWDRKAQVKVYYDQLFSLVLATDTQLVARTVQYTPVGKPQWIQSSTTVGTNQIFCLAISDSSSGVHPAFEFGSVIGFTDS